MELDEERRNAAIARLREKRDFKQHALVFLAVNAALIGLWLVTGAGYFWPIWVIGGWGIGFVLHAFRVWGQNPITEAEIREEVKRLERSHGGGI